MIGDHHANANTTCSSIDTTEVPCARDPLRPATNTRHRHYHTDEDFSEEDVGKTKSSRKRPPEGMSDSWY